MVRNWPQVRLETDGIGFCRTDYFDDTQFDLKEIEAAIPTGMQDVKTQLLWDNRFYCITFRTPGVC